MREQILALGRMLGSKPRHTASVGAIFPGVPTFWECGDGSLSTSGTRRRCRSHGGPKSDFPLDLAGENLLGVRDVRLSDIQTAKHLFQGREKDFSERSVSNIVGDVESGRFVWANLDPVTLWENPEDKKLYLLSGHSRFEAFRRLAAAMATASGKNFTRIPAKVLKNVPLEVAATVALESNTLSTKETDLERANYYRRLRQDGTDEKKLRAMVQKNEGKNWVNVYAYTFLNPAGKTWAMLRSFAEGEDTSATLAKSLAKWIGAARREHPYLTPGHETELFNWIFEEKGYGTGAGQVKSEAEFQEKVLLFINRNTFFGNFDAAKPLNIQNALLKTPSEQAFDQQIEEAKKLITDLENEYRAKIKTLTARGATQMEVSRIVAPLEANITAARTNLAKLMQKRAQVLEHAKNEISLFGIGNIFKSKPPGQHVCRDGLFSTSAGRGACSRHGGVKTWFREKGEKTDATPSRMEAFKAAKIRVAQMEAENVRILKKYPNGWRRRPSEEEKAHLEKITKNLTEIQNFQLFYATELLQEKAERRILQQIQVLKTPSGRRLVRVTEAEAGEMIKDLENKLRDIWSGSEKSRSRIQRKIRWVI